MPSKKDRDLVDFVKSTLIPDLKESGRTYTASDMSGLVKIIEKLWKGK
tara:strand:- start:192 stop:335 length:144 start_codon:yes stop_codon:yes gene_type:complete